MKIAILISGQPRFLNSRAYKTIKEKLLDVYNCDVYCHFWWNPNGGYYSTSPWSTLGNFPIPKDADKKIEELYKPIKYTWELPTNIKTNYTKTINMNNNINLPSMYLSMKKSFDLIENINQYEWIIRLRYDDILTSFPNLNLLDKNIDLYVPDYREYHNLIGNNCLIMNSKAAKCIMNIYDNIDFIYNNNIIFNDEQFITFWIMYNKLKYIIINKQDFFVELQRTE